MTRNRHIGLERRDGFDVGRDPRALRLNCLDCCNGSTQEVRLCTAVDCPSWPFRMGKNPWRRKPGQEERAALRARLAPKDASAPTAAQKTGREIDASASDGVRVPNDMADDFSPTEMDDDQGDAS